MYRVAITLLNTKLVSLADQMKKVSLKNPTEELVALMGESGHAEFILEGPTGGYFLVTGELPDEVTVVELKNHPDDPATSASPTTIRTDTDEGFLLHAMALALQPKTPVIQTGYRAAEKAASAYNRNYEILKKALGFLRAGLAGDRDEVLRMAATEVEQSERVQRQVKRTDLLAKMVREGMTPKEANASYGIGRWSAEQDWPQVKKRLLEIGWEKAHKQLTEASFATNKGAQNKALEGLEMFTRASFPRCEAWVCYALTIFYNGPKVGWKKMERHEFRNLPTRGKSWEFVNP